MFCDIYFLVSKAIQVLFYATEQKIKIIKLLYIVNYCRFLGGRRFLCVRPGEWRGVPLKEGRPGHLASK